MTGGAESRIEPLTGSGAEWDEFVAASELGTFCHLSGWREIMMDVLGHECRYLVAHDEEGGWTGVLPLVHVQSRIFGDYLISMPFLNYGGPLGTVTARARLTEQAVAEARELGADLLELRSRQPVPCDLPVSRRKVTVTLELPSAPETLWDDVFKPKLRSQIRRPRKEGMVTRFGFELVDAFYEVFSKNMRDLGTPVLPKALFERLVAVFPDVVHVGVVFKDDRPVAGGCGFLWHGEFEMTWASSLREFSREAPNMLLYWSFIERAIEHGATIFNFGRCTAGGGTHRFKLQWGGSDLPLPWTQWSPKGKSETPSPDRPLYQLASAVWGRMPLALANRIGPVLARKLP
jgi:FemAB-related protein (PEP-CTERM system-associated)